MEKHGRGERVDIDGACSDSLPSSAASEDAIDLNEPGISVTKIQDSVRHILCGIGETVHREGLRDTPKRVAKAWMAATEGYKQSVRSVLGSALFHEQIGSRRDNTVVLVQDIDFASTSEHNLLPFLGQCHVAYIPRDGVVIGLSKVARLAKMFARRLQNQQRFTDQLLEAFNAEVQPLGCAALVEASQLGDGEHHGHQVTTAALGCFYDCSDILMQEFLSLLGRDPHYLPSLLQPRQRHASMLSKPEAVSHSSLAASCRISGQEADGMEAAVESILREIGEDPQREGLQGSARRYVQHLMASTVGMLQSVPKQRGGGLGQVNGCMNPPECWQNSEVVELDLPFTSHCEHHILPFQGTVQILSLAGPSGARLLPKAAEDVVAVFSRRLQIQERLTHQVASALHSGTAAAGTLVVARASHMCMVARGVEKHASTTVTLAALGAFEADAALRGKALQRLRARHRPPAPVL